MWVYFYISGKAVQDLGRQLGSTLPSERTRQTTVAGNAKGGFHASLSKLFSILGQAEASADVDASVSRTLEEKFNIPEASVVDVVAHHLESSRNYSRIAAGSHPGMMSSLKRLVRFQGTFRPDLHGTHPAEQHAFLEKTSHINWKGSCGNISVFFTTGKDSLISKTPLYKCVSDDGTGLALEGFAILDARNTKRADIEIIPLFFGVELE